jgi:hypothetical protein
MKLKNLILLFAVMLFSSSSVFAASTTDVFQKQKNVDIGATRVPTVVEVPFSNDYLESNVFAVYNKTASSFEPYYFRKTSNLIPVTAEIESDYSVDIGAIIDNNFNTYKEFDVSSGIQGRSKIVLIGASPITSNHLTISLDQYVALPNTIEIKASLAGNEKVVVATQKLNNYNIDFLETTADKWIITFTYGQPLRIAELTLRQNGKKTNNQGLRFLAQPNNSYIVYFNPDKYFNVAVGEAGNLSSNEGVVYLKEITTQNNPNYTLADTDEDSIPDIRDNCVEVSNPDQADLNSNGRGDACDDFDKDGIINIKDNCPNNPNQSQIDSDSDKIGDACDKEESRLTEKYKFIPWLGIVFAMGTIIILFAITYKKKEN